MKSVYSAVRTGSLNTAVCASALEGYGADIQLNLCFKGKKRRFILLSTVMDKQFRSYILKYEQVRPDFLTSLQYKQEYCAKVTANGRNE